MPQKESPEKLVHHSPRWLFRVCFLTLLATVFATIMGVSIIVESGALWATAPLLLTSFIIIYLAIKIDNNSNKKYDGESTQRITAYLRDNYSLSVFPSEVEELCDYYYDGAVRAIKAENLFTGKQTKVGVQMSSDGSSLTVFKISRTGGINKALKKRPVGNTNQAKQYS